MGKVKAMIKNILTAIVMGHWQVSGLGDRSVERHLFVLLCVLSTSDTI